MPRFAVTVIGQSPLLMHNARLVDPLDRIVEDLSEYTSKTRKTKDDHIKIGHLEWLGGLYYDATLGPFIPAPNLQKSIVEGARLSRDGKKIERGVLIETMMIPVEYEGPRDLVKLWEHPEKAFAHRAPVKIQQNRTMRTRPFFRQWRLRATGMYDASVIDFTKLQAAAVTAGRMIGLGDGRPTYGRYEVEMEAIGE